MVRTNSLFREETLARTDKQGNLSLEVSKTLLSAPQGKGYFSKRGCWNVRALRLNHVLTQALPATSVRVDDAGEQLCPHALFICAVPKNYIRLLQPYLKRRPLLGWCTYLLFVTEALLAKLFLQTEKKLKFENILI